jgi:hypothetical protein
MIAIFIKNILFYYEKLNYNRVVRNNEKVLKSLSEIYRQIIS